MRKSVSTIKSSPKAGVDAKATEGEVRTFSQINPKESTAKEASLISEIEKTTEGQRGINILWESTQSKIALRAVTAGLALNGICVIGVLLLSVFKIEVTVNQIALVSLCLQFINLTVGIIIGFYFSRTNHSAIGGVGLKPQMQQYEGR